MKTETHGCQVVGVDLKEGQEILFNDRSRPLVVTGRHERKRTSRAMGDISNKHDIIELEGNGTEYHLLCSEGSSIGPMLYKEADWDDHKEDKYGQSPVYSRHGERIEEMEIL